MQAGLMLPGSVRGDGRREGRRGRERERQSEKGGEEDYKLLAKESSLYTVMTVISGC